MLFALSAAPAAAHASLVRSDPAPNTVLPSAPATLTLWFDEELDPLYSGVSLLAAGGARVDANRLVFDPDHKRITADVQPALPPGAYTVVWRALSAADGHLTRGAYALYIGTLSAQPVVLNLDAGEGNALPLPFEVVVRWLNLLAALTLCGALGLNLLLGDASPAFALARQRSARRRRLLVMACLLVLFLGTIFGVLIQAAAASERSLVDVLAQSIWLHTLTATRFGQAGLARIVLVDLLLVLVAAGGSAPAAGEPGPAGAPPAQRVVAAGGSTPAAGEPGQAAAKQSVAAGRGADGLRIGPLWNVRVIDLLYAGLGALILLTFSLSSHAAAADDTLELGLFGDWLHLLAIGAWTGGLMALAVVFAGAAAAAEPPPDVLWQVLRRFSNVALVAVVLLGVTGLYAAWRQVGSAAALTGTPYGLTLIIKNLTLAPLLLLGLLNTLLLRPALAARVLSAAAKWGRGGRRFGAWFAALAAQSQPAGGLTPPARQWPQPGAAGQPAGGLTPPARQWPQPGAAGQPAGGLTPSAQQWPQPGAAGQQRALLPIVRLEALLAALVLLSAAALTALPPARTAVAAAPPPPFRMTRQTSDLMVTLTVDPYMVAANQNFEVQLSDLQGGPAAGVTGVSLHFALLSTGLGSATQPMQAAGGGVFRLQGSYLSAVGSWTVDALIARSGVPEAVPVPFRLQVSDPATARPAELPPISSTLWFSFFDLGAGIALIVFSQRRNMIEGKWIGAGAIGLGIVLFLMGTVLASPTAAVYVTNPIVPDAGSLARGAALYSANCAVCHGADGRGNGPLAPSLNPRPADFVQHVNFHTDDVLFDFISKGIPGTAMQGWEGTLTETDRWNVLNYIQALVERAAATPAAGK